jgi:hypothetical protein
MHPLEKLYSSCERIFKINLQDITHEESLKEMRNCNSANWILGHVVYTRDGILAQLGQTPVAGERLKEVYGRGVVKPDMAKALPLDTLKKMYEQSQPAIMERVGKITDETIMDQITFLGFHEAYHLGQIGLLRKMLGKEGAIK